MLVPVILSGGAGTRLWPVSREGHPKPFMRLADGQSLLQKTFLRGARQEGAGEVLTITNRDYYFRSKDEYAALRQREPRQSFLLEPFGRNTAPAILLGAFKVREAHGDDAVMLVLPADHLIADTAGFARHVQHAVAAARQGKLVTFGIVPTAPETGFGYIACGAADGQIRQVRGFVEKPSLEVAQGYLASGDYLWNSGMFCFTAGAALAAFREHCPTLFAAGEACWAASRGEGSATTEIDADSFAGLEDISIDYAIMEKAANVAVVPASFDWSDIGSWNAMSQLVEPDENNNRAIGETITFASHGCYIHGDDRLIAALGVDDLIVVDTPDALLISHKDHTQDVKKVVQKLKTMGHDSYRLHRTVSRPWGTYTVLEEGDRYKIKRIEVKPGASLSLQMHHHRNEHWIVVSGMARVTNGEKGEFLVHTNESTYIPAGHKHRLENPGVIDLVMIEVQSGEYLGEDDIVRFADNYGRS